MIVKEKERKMEKSLKLFLAVITAAVAIAAITQTDVWSKVTGYLYGHALYIESVPGTNVASIDTAGALTVTGITNSGALSATAITGTTGAFTSNVSVAGNLAVTGSQADVPNTSYSAIAVSSSISPVGVSFLVINASGALTSTATPFISTTTAISGQVLTLMGGANVLTLADEGSTTGTLLELGAASRALGAGDILRLRYYSGKWYEESFVNN